MQIRWRSLISIDGKNYRRHRRPRSNINGLNLVSANKCLKIVRACAYILGNTEIWLGRHFTLKLTLGRDNRTIWECFSCSNRILHYRSKLLSGFGDPSVIKNSRLGSRAYRSKLPPGFGDFSFTKQNRSQVSEILGQKKTRVKGSKAVNSNNWQKINHFKCRQYRHYWTLTIYTLSSRTCYALLIYHNLVHQDWTNWGRHIILAYHKLVCQL